MTRVYSDNQTQHINTHCGRDSGYINVTAGDACKYQ